MTIRAKDFFEKEMGCMTFGAFLTAVRTNADLSQVDLGRRLEISRSMVYDIEKGRVTVIPVLPSVAHLLRHPGVSLGKVQSRCINRT